MGEEEQAEKASPKRDYIVELGTHAQTVGYHSEVMTKLGKLQPGSTLVFLSPSAHPGAWVAAREAKAGAFVLARRQSRRSLAHGQELGRRLRHEALQLQIPRANNAPAPKPFHEIDCPPPSGEQIMEAHEVTQGSRWHEGLNLRLALHGMDDLMIQTLTEELDPFTLSLADVRPNIGRGLITRAPRREGDIFC